MNKEFARPFLSLFPIFSFSFIWQLLKAKPKATQPFSLLCLPYGWSPCFTQSLCSIWLWASAPGLTLTSTAGVCLKAAALPDSSSLLLFVRVTGCSYKQQLRPPVLLPSASETVISTFNLWNVSYFLKLVHYFTESSQSLESNVRVEVWTHRNFKGPHSNPSK